MWVHHFKGEKELGRASLALDLAHYNIGRATYKLRIWGFLKCLVSDQWEAIYSIHIQSNSSSILTAFKNISPHKEDKNKHCAHPPDKHIKSLSQLH